MDAERIKEIIERFKEARSIIDKELDDSFTPQIVKDQMLLAIISTAALESRQAPRAISVPVVPRPAPARIFARGVLDAAYLEILNVGRIDLTGFLTGHSGDIVEIDITVVKEE